MGYGKIAQRLREHGYETPRGKRSFAQHVYSMIKKHKLREEKLNHKPELEYGPLRFEYVDHTPSYLKNRRYTNLLVTNILICRLKSLTLGRYLLLLNKRHQK